MSIVGPYAGPPKRPQTWVQVSTATMRLMAGDTGIIVLSEGVEWFTSSDGRLWRRVR